MLSASETGPTLPMNIIIISMTFEMTLHFAVTPVESPDVEIAEVTSYAASSPDTFGLRLYTASEDTIIRKANIIATVSAL